MIQAVEGDDVMLDVAKNIKRRFMNSKDVHDVANKLEREGYVVIESIYEDLTFNGNTLYSLDVYKDDNKIVQVIYKDRHDETEYKQYILYILY